jgi:site-specific DNA-methyltransferase (adenine-specific)
MSFAPDLRLGRWQDVLADVDMVDAVITDPPYSARTHEAQRSDQVAASKSFAELEYQCFTPEDVAAFVAHWSPRCRGWFVVFSDHELQLVWERELEAAGRYVFAPLPQVTTNRSVRLAGDGPATWTTWITVARPRTREFASWGALVGAYVDGVGQRAAGLVRGAKQLHLMKKIVRDYTRPGDLIVDPCAGGATALRAAQIEGRRSIGAEMDPDTYAKAMDRLRGWGPAESKGQPNLFGGAA